MMRVDLLRSLPPSPLGSPPKRRAGGSLKVFVVILVVLGFLLGAGAVIWRVKPGWIPAPVATAWDSLANGGASAQRAHADSLRRAEAVALRASRQIEARQAAVIEWLYQLELLQSARSASPPAARGPHGSQEPPEQTRHVTLVASTFTASGEFVLEGRAASAEALSALQEAMVLIPGMDLRESEATEVAGSRDPAFDFRFAGSIHDGTPAGERATDGSAVDPNPDDSVGVERADSTKNVLPAGGMRLAEAATVNARLEAFVQSATERGVAFAPPSGPGATSRAGALQAHFWTLRGVVTPPPDAAVSPLTVLRELLEHERHHASPFAIQRITVNERRGQTMVFLDILALTP